MKNYILIPILIFNSIFIKAYSQNKIENLKSIWNDQNALKAERFDACYDLIKDHYLNQSLDSAYTYIQNLDKFIDVHELKNQKPDLNLLMGLLEYKLGNYNDAFEHYNLSLKQFKEKKDTTGIISVMNNIGLLYNNEFRFKEAINYLKKSLILADKINSPEEKFQIYANLGFVFNNSFKVDSSYVYLKKALDIAESYNKPKEFILKEIGNNFVKRKLYDSSLVYFENALKESEINKNTKVQSLTNFAISTQYIFQKKYEKSIPFAEKAYYQASAVNDPVMKKGSLLNLYEIYKALNNNDKALNYLEKVNLEDDVIEEVSFNRNLQKFEIEQIKLRDSLKNEQLFIKREMEYKKDKKILQVTWISVLALVLVISLSFYFIQKREKKILSQKILISKEKLNNLIKDEELRSISAMVEGQEKERQRIANDLHDDLGSLMANIKIHFSNFKNKDSDHLYQRTSDLIEEAYQKIRQIAHAKNSGLLAKQGLFEAIKKHAKSVSASKEIKIQVIENGLSDRLENSIELTIFRVVQELMTNTIKHAKATELDIHLNQHDSTLNIVVEDNGIGFNNAKSGKEQSGMGLLSIERRINALGGSVIIESKPSNGTSVIINIPLQ
jgi:signal transduction histidine kinase